MGRLLPNSLSPIFVSWVRCLPGQLYKVEGIQDNEMNWTDHYGVCCAASSQVGFCDDKVLKRYNQFLYYYTCVLGTYGMPINDIMSGLNVLAHRKKQVL